MANFAVPTPQGNALLKYLRDAMVNVESSVFGNAIMGGDMRLELLVAQSLVSTFIQDTAPSMNKSELSASQAKQHARGLSQPVNSSLQADTHMYQTEADAWYSGVSGGGYGGVRRHKRRNLSLISLH